MKESKEIILHFTCEECKGWFSIAASFDADSFWKPKKLFCPHCGKLYKFEDDIRDN